MSYLSSTRDLQRSTSWRMNAGDVVRVRSRQLTILRLLRGTAWVTRDGDTGDYILSQGEELSLADRTGAVVQALGNAIVRAFEARTTRGVDHDSPMKASAVQSRLK